NPGQLAGAGHADALLGGLVALDLRHAVPILLSAPAPGPAASLSFSPRPACLPPSAPPRWWLTWPSPRPASVPLQPSAVRPPAWRPLALPRASGPASVPS